VASDAQAASAGGSENDGGGATSAPAPTAQPDAETVQVALATGAAVAAGAPLLGGDGNSDGCVTAADYTIWADNFGTSAPVGPSEGDYNGDGAVTGADYTIWADNFTGDCVAAPPAVEEIEVTPSVAMLTRIGETVAFAAQTLTVAGEEVASDVTWHSSHPDQLKVDQAGQVTALGVGTAVVWAEASGVESSASMVDMVLLDPNAYVTNTAADLVTVIDTLTNVVLTTIPVGASPTRVAVARDGSRAFVANTGGNSISVIDAATNTVTATIPVTSAPVALTVTPNGAEVYVLCIGGLMQVIDTALIGGDSDPVIATTSFGAPSFNVFNQFGASIALLPDGARGYAVISGALHAFSTTSYEVLGSTNVGPSPSQLTLSPDGSRIYVTGASSVALSGQVSVVNSATLQPLANILLPGVLPDAIGISPDGTLAYVASVQRFADTGYGMAFVPDNHLAAIDLTTNVVLDWIPLPGSPSGGVSITPDGLQVYVSMPGSDWISVVDTATHTLIGSTIAVDAVPTGLAMSAAQALAD